LFNTASAFSLVEHKVFIEFCEITIHQTPMTRKTLMMHLDKTFEKMKIEMFEELKKEEWVCVMADCWTAFRRSYLDITIHWLDHDTLERKSKGLACCRLEGKHTYEILAKTVELILIEFN
ncbi:Putative AC9 transposase, partial [Harpegnathos saltator]